MGLLFMLFGLANFVMPIVAIVALVRTSRLRRRIEALEGELHRDRPATATPPREHVPVVPEAGRGIPPPAAPTPTATPPRPPVPPPAPTPPRPPEPRVAPPPPSPPPPAAAPRRIDWEQLLGVRAAAVVSAIALGLAGLLFFKYSIEHGLFPPWLRVLLGTLVGLASVAGSELALRRRYAGTANTLAGGGLVVLYAAFWAASVRYELIGLAPGFVLMALVTVAGCALAWRHEAQIIAVLGLIGGFATPLLVSSGADRPFGLFGYLLMLDAGLIYLATSRGWPRIALLGVIGTALYQLGWIGFRMGPDRLPLGLGILAVFSLTFAWATRRSSQEKKLEWYATQAGALLFPFAFAFYFAWDARIAPHLLPIGLFLGILSAAAAWLARVQRTYEFSLAAAAAGVGVLLFWSVPPHPVVDPVWQLLAVSVGLACVFHVFVESAPERSGWDGPAPSAIVAAVGHLGVLVLAMLRAPDAGWVWVAAYGALAAILVRHASLPERGQLDFVSAILLALALRALTDAPGSSLAPVTFQGVALAAAVAYQVVALWRGSMTAPAWANHGAGGIAAILSATCTAQMGSVPALVFLGTPLAFGVLMALVSARIGSGGWLLAAVLLTAAAHAAFPWSPDGATHAGLGLVAGALGVLVFTAWPFLAGPRLRAERLAWSAAALAGPAWFWPLRTLFVLRFGDAAIGILPIVLGAVALVAAVRARAVIGGEQAGLRTSALAWLSAVALGFVSVAIPLQLDKSWITIGWALEGVAVILLWTRLDHAGLKYFGLGLLAAVTVRLVTNPAVLGYYPRPSWRIVNWLLYTYLVPAAALLGAARLLHPLEVARASAWERETVYRFARPLGAIACALAALTVVFVWLNLAIADWFATGTTLTVSFDRLPARDLATSIAWAVYAVILLGIGMARASIGLRWVSLGLLIVTIAKVFLHDLGELRDLYRVASLVGLAISLLGVSLAYQRFVFRDAPAEEQR